MLYAGYFYAPKYSGGSGKVFFKGVVGEQPSARKQHAVIKVHLVVSFTAKVVDVYSKIRNINNIGYFELVLPWIP